MGYSCPTRWAHPYGQSAYMLVFEFFQLIEKQLVVLLKNVFDIIGWVAIQLYSIHTVRAFSPILGIECLVRATLINPIHKEEIAAFPSELRFNAIWISLYFSRVDIYQNHHVYRDEKGFSCPLPKNLRNHSGYNQSINLLTKTKHT